MTPEHDNRSCSLPFRILYEDNHLLAADKPAGMLTQSDPGGGPSLEQSLREYVRESRNKPGAAYLHVAHRLDRDVGGIVLCALTSKALSRLNAQQREQSWRKVYRAWVSGAPAAGAGRLVHWLRHGEHRSEVVREGDTDAKESALEFRVLRRESDRALLEIVLHTGRYHQIRAQLAAAGMPILGDSRYGATAQWSGAGIALRHVELEIEHPVRHSALLIEAPDAEFREPQRIVLTP
jgi:23S rRNA pseudouridine1911/1915/1917 synthase